MISHIAVKSPVRLKQSMNNGFLAAWNGKTDIPPVVQWKKNMCNMRAGRGESRDLDSILHVMYLGDTAEDATTITAALQQSDKNSARCAQRLNKCTYNTFVSISIENVQSLQSK